MPEKETVERASKPREKAQSKSIFIVHLVGIKRTSTFSAQNNPATAPGATRHFGSQLLLRMIAPTFVNELTIPFCAWLRTLELNRRIFVPTPAAVEFCCRGCLGKSVS